MFARYCLKSVALRAACCRRPLLVARPAHLRYFASELPGKELSSSEDISQGTRALLAGNAASALSHFERALSKSGEMSATADVYYNKGVCEYSLGKTDAAIASWQQSLALDASRSDVHANIGNAYFLNRRDVQSAISHMKQAAELAPDDAEIHFNLGCLYESAGDSDLRAAISSYDRAVQLGLEKAKTHLRNAMAKQISKK
ncbi:hypothetical protein IWW38_000934 [Coemansia aciculifera]|uniref:Uncharacterized protein n=1 Tax=Coemansia aciculifera TaxID=417176 RepID=A0ACC1M8N0_9FUNG|nr:hypothetical protein IWW38_000934 [Coemansia aciculifera]